MRTLLFPALALLALSACNNKAQNEAAEANETITGDSNTMGEAVADVNAANAATDAAFDAAENSYEANASDAGVAGNEITD
jgi:hypothetical protein